MNATLKEFLFRKHVLVSDMGLNDVNPENAFSAMVALKQKFGIRIEDGFEFASEQVIRDAEYFLGEHVPEPFYRGFPKSVLELTTDQRFFDQLLHYSVTSGLGWCRNVTHSTMETIMNRLAFNEAVTTKDFIIVDATNADTMVKGMIRELLYNKRSPLSIQERSAVFSGWDQYQTEIIPDKIACKKTAVELLYYSKNTGFLKALDLPDTIKLLEYILYTNYGTERTNQLNLKNQDRKLLTKVIDHLLIRATYKDIKDCFEKRKTWCGLLHHIHYKPKTPKAESFVNSIRSGPTWSFMSEFELTVESGHPVLAAKELKREKGEGALLRNLNYILSRCKSDNEVMEVLENV